MHHKTFEILRTPYNYHLLLNFKHSMSWKGAAPEIFDFTWEVKSLQR